MANSNWADDNLPKPPIPSALPRPVNGPKGQPTPALDAFLASVGQGPPTFDPLAELVSEACVELFVSELDTVSDCPACFAQHFTLGETCRKHDV